MYKNSQDDFCERLSDDRPRLRPETRNVGSLPGQSISSPLSRVERHVFFSLFTFHFSLFTFHHYNSPFSAIQASLKMVLR